MRTRLIVCAVALLGAVVILTDRAVSDDQDQPPQPTPEQMAEMEEWKKLNTPGEHHKHLNYFVGKWRTKTKMWMGGPGSQSMDAGDGVSNVKWVLDGRFLLDEHKGSFMGQPHDGIGMTGYDNYRNVYFSSWASNMATHVLTMTGMRHPKTGVFTYYGEMDEPSIKVVGRTVKYVTRIVSDNQYVFEIIDLHAGDDYKVIEITYTRM